MRLKCHCTRLLKIVVDYMLLNSFECSFQLMSVLDASVATN